MGTRPFHHEYPMIQPVTLSRLPTGDPPSRASASPTAFTQSLAAFLDTLTVEPPPAPLIERTDDAAPGKPLPEDKASGDQLAWLAAMLPPVPVPPPTMPLALDPIVGAARPTDIAMPPAPPVTVPVAGDTTQPTYTPFDLAQDARRTMPGPISAALIAPPGVGAGASISSSPAVQPHPTTPDPILANPKMDRALPALPVGAPPPTVPPLPPTTAAHVFAAAMHEAAAGENKPAHIGGDTTPLPTALAQIEAQRHAVAATGDVQSAPLDLGHPGWPHRMIERIEQMRDAADAGDTRIRLVPNALGTIDVGVRREGDILHVHFSAEQATTARMLSDAQPRLAELAEARGIRLGGTAVDAGGAGGTNAREHRAPQHVPTAPVSTRADTLDTTTTDARIA